MEISEHPLILVRLPCPAPPPPQTKKSTMYNFVHLFFNTLNQILYNPMPRSLGLTTEYMFFCSMHVCMDEI